MIRYIETEKLRKEYGNNKIIPFNQQSAILKALSFYPELKDTKIEFRFMRDYPVPYGTRPDFFSFFRPPEKRKYIITFRKKAPLPLKKALLKNLPSLCQVAAIGHELAHVVQFQSMGAKELIKAVLFYVRPSFKERFERDADIRTIRHGLGRELYIHARYLRSIPGYTEQRDEINKYYLKPGEIRLYLNNDNTLEKSPLRSPVYE